MRRGAALLILAAWALSGCATTPPAPPKPAAAAFSDARALAYDDAARQARAMERDGRLREARWWWDVATAVAPSPQTAQAEASRIQAQIGPRVTALLDEGDKARRKRAMAQATEAYRQALSLDPQSARARAALREMDAEAVLRAIARGGGGGPAAPSRSASH